MTTRPALASQAPPRSEIDADRPALERARRRRTTFSCLTGLSVDLLEEALVQAGPAGLADGWLDETSTAHRDLTHAMAHLGATLLGMPAVHDLRGLRPAGPRGSDRRLVMLLSRRASLRDWEQPPADAGTVADLLTRAARAARAAADLWATHHCDVGLARSPDASRLRHPAMRGAATREWRGLVVASGAMADQLVHHARTAGHPVEYYRDMMGYPLPLATSPARAPATDPVVDRVVVDLTVARPGRLATRDPLTEVQDRVGNLRSLTWRMSQAGLAPVDLLATSTAIGTMLAVAAEQANRAAADVDPLRSELYLRRAVRSADQAAGWRVVAPLLVDLRSPLPASAVMVTDRRDLAELLAGLTELSTGPAIRETADGLAAVGERYTEVAHYLAVALRRARQRRAVLIAGRSLSHQVLRHRPDLLEAKLRDQVVIAPDRIVVAIEQALRAVAALHDPLEVGM